MTNKINFTKSTLMNIKPPVDKRFAYYMDTKEKGLELTVTEKGTKSFALRKRLGNKTRFTIVRFPDLSIEQARRIAAQYKGKIAIGIDPKEEKNSLKNDITFGDMCDKFMSDFSAKQKTRPKEDRSTIDNYLAKFKSKKATKISKNDIQELHNFIALNVGQTRANRVYSLISSIFNKNIEWGWNHPNPCIGIKKFKEKSRDRFLQPDELEAFFKAVDEEESKINKNCVMILLLTGARKSNVFAMKWEEIGNFLLE